MRDICVDIPMDCGRYNEAFRADRIPAPDTPLSYSLSIDQDRELEEMIKETELAEQENLTTPLDVSGLAWGVAQFSPFAFALRAFPAEKLALGQTVSCLLLKTG